MAGVALTLVRLGHEGDRHPLLGGDLLGPVLVDRVVVAGGERLGEPEGDLVLPEVALALGRLDVHPRALHAESDPAQQGLDAGAAEQRVVDVVLVGGREVAVGLGPGALVAVVVDHELQLGADVRRPAALGEAGELPAQDLAGGGGDVGAVLPEQVGHQHDRALLPGHPAQGGQVGLHHEVAVAALPGRHAVAVDGVHVDVHREEVVAPLGRVVQHLLQEVPRGQPLALEASLHVGDGQKHGVHPPGGHLVTQLVDGEHGASLPQKSGNRPLEACKHQRRSRVNGSGHLSRRMD